MSIMEFYGLKDWVYSFPESEKNILLSCAELTGEVGDGLPCASFALAWSLQYYSKKENSELVQKVYDKIFQIDDKDKMSVNDLHFFYSVIISAIYKFRDTWAHDIVVELCEKSIELSPAAAKTFDYAPNHIGYNTLIAIEKKAHNWRRVYDLAADAIRNGWHGKYDAWKIEAEKHL